METIYLGYIIAPETEPWAIKYGFNYIVYPEGNQPDDQLEGFKTLEEAKDYIDQKEL